MEKVLLLIEHVKSGFWSFLVLLTFWPNNYLLWGCLVHWKMFISTPGLYPLETKWEVADILKMSKSIKLLVKMKNVSYFQKYYKRLVETLNKNLLWGALLWGSFVLLTVLWYRPHVCCSDGEIEVLRGWVSWINYNYTVASKWQRLLIPFITFYFKLILDFLRN